MDAQTAAQNYIETLKAQIAEIDTQINPLLEKRKAKASLANATAADVGLPIPFADVDSGAAIIATPAAEVIAPDHYTGKKMATACREIMQRRKARGQGAITLDDLYTQLKSGGYGFRAVGKDNAVTSLATTLGKNSQFRRVPGSVSLWGLAEWYGGPVRRAKSAAAGATEDDDDEEIVEDAPNTPASSPEADK
jgi:hypothetical protein